MGPRIGMPVQYFEPTPPAQTEENAKCARVIKLNAGLNVDLEVRNDDGSFKVVAGVVFHTGTLPNRWRYVPT